KELRSLIEEIHCHDCSHDPLSRGAYSSRHRWSCCCSYPCRANRRDSFFAGEATDYEGNYENVHGALASGLRAAKEILKTSFLIYIFGFIFLSYRNRC
ncbi:MAG: FAD-dependent oxidoreductase, partial [Verrucomicrobia bacterium]|nr:FAD-dependent oxidoreductase [Verrucomicrobiota bacterium]